MKRVFLMLAAVVSLGACTPGIHGDIAVDRIGSDEQAQGMRAQLAPLKVGLHGFVDSRLGADSMVSYAGQQLRPQGDVTGVVERAFGDKLRANGVQLTPFEAPQIRGEISEWSVAVREGFPSAEAEATAKVVLNLYSPDNRLIYRAHYEGTTLAKNPFMSKAEVEEALSLAMNEALNQAASDDDLLSRFSSSR